MSDIFSKIDQNIENVLAPQLKQAEELIHVVRYILDNLGKRRGIIGKRRTEYRENAITIIERKTILQRHYEVFYKDRLVFHTDDYKRVYRFLDGPWIQELPNMYLKAKIAHLEIDYNIDYLGELCDFYDHNDFCCSLERPPDWICPCFEFEHEEEEV